ncbi:MAG: hypothetical protein LUO83_09230 [Methanothrix sp.]|nr:hypothetical protein [Methanothrix sp.]
MTSCPLLAKLPTRAASIARPSSSTVPPRPRAEAYSATRIFMTAPEEIAA